MGSKLSGLRREPYTAALSRGGPPAAMPVAPHGAPVGEPVGGEHGGAGFVPGRGGGGRH
ncbi:hypothetical protein [Streptomyces sp. NPDC006285]|uniref:hypothetical protein n=1 Tax=Streptomyces sp. NPDC006285 TaxID=3364742 RepID=UPI0036989CC7